jgi:hypothetical protein
MDSSFVSAEKVEARDYSGMTGVTQANDIDASSSATG